MFTTLVLYIIIISLISCVRSVRACVYICNSERVPPTAGGRQAPVRFTYSSFIP